MILTTKQRFDIDPIRGVVAISLAVLHFYVASDLSGRFDQLFGNTGKWIVWNIRFGVESFFVLAGLLLAYSLRPVPGARLSIGGYLLRRFVRLVIPLWIAIWLVAANQWLPTLLGISTHTPPSTLREILIHMTFLDELFGIRNAAIGYWSMVSLEQFYILYILCFYVVGKLTQFAGKTQLWDHERWMAHLVLMVALSSAGWVIFRYQTGMPGQDATHPELNSPYAAQFKVTTFAMFLCLGILLFWAVRCGFARIHCGLAFAAVLSVGIFAGNNQQLAWKACLMAVILIPLSKGIQFPKNWLTRGLAFVGKRSYSLYLMHPIIGYRVLLVDRKLHQLGNWVVIFELIFAVACSIIGAYLFYRFVEGRCLQLAQKIQYRPQPVSGA